MIDTRTIMPDDPFPADEAGVWVDIFPFDGAIRKDYSPSTDSRFWRVLSNLLVLKNLRLFSRKRPILKSVLIILASPLRLLPNHFLYAPMRRMAMLHSFSSSPLRGCLVWGSGHKELLSADAIDHEIDVDFEGGRFKAMCGWREYLSSVYGDFMTLPPENKRVPTHLMKVYWKDGTKQ